MSKCSQAKRMLNQIQIRGRLFNQKKSFRDKVLKCKKTKQFFGYDYTWHTGMQHEMQLFFHVCIDGLHTIKTFKATLINIGQYISAIYIHHFARTH